MLNPITDLSALAEQLCRIEHKLDLLITFFASQNGEFQLTQMSEGALDPLTLKPVEYYMDLMKRHVVRKASDGTGLLPPSSVLFTPQANQSVTGTSNNDGNQGGDNGG